MVWLAWRGTRVCAGGRGSSALLVAKVVEGPSLEGMALFSCGSRELGTTATPTPWPSITAAVSSSSRPQTRSPPRPSHTASALPSCAPSTTSNWPSAVSLSRTPSSTPGASAQGLPPQNEDHLSQGRGPKRCEVYSVFSVSRASTTAVLRAGCSGGRRPFSLSISASSRRTS